jgi:hypothetical protein
VIVPGDLAWEGNDRVWPRHRASLLGCERYDVTFGFMSPRYKWTLSLRFRLDVLCPISY